MADTGYCMGCAVGTHPHDAWKANAPEVQRGQHQAGDDAGCPHAGCQCVFVKPRRPPNPHCPTCQCGLTPPAGNGHTITLYNTETKKGRRKYAECSCGWISPHTRNVQAAQNVIFSQHPEALCPTPDKKRYDTERDAELALLKFWQTAPEWKKEVRRTYECLCGKWHTTSKPVKVRS